MKPFVAHDLLGPASLSAGILLLLGAPCSASAQRIAFEGELPRTLVFIEEEGRGKVASREMTSFLLEAGFPVIDPSLAIDQASQELVAQANNGNNGAATQLGRDWGAQVLILGVADYATRPDPVSGTLVTASCSFHVGLPEFLTMLTEAAGDSGRRIYLRRILGQSEDHPEVLTIPETGYLKGAVLGAE